MIPENNLKAFLKTIRYCEGTDLETGYNTMFGGTRRNPRLFHDFTDHPRIKQKAAGITSTAAGAYQFLSTTWDYLAKKLKLADFSPPNQDRACIELFREKGALEDIKAGRVEVAVKKLNKTWASLPESPYGQPTHSIQDVIDYYKAYGGQVA